METLQQETEDECSLNVGKEAKQVKMRSRSNHTDSGSSTNGEQKDRVNEPFHTFCALLKPCIEQLAAMDRPNEVDDVHPVANAVVLFALQVYKCSPTGSTEKTYWSRSKDVWFAVEKWNPDKVSTTVLKEAVLKLVKFVQKNILRKKTGTMVVVGRKQGGLSRKADMVVIQHEVPPLETTHENSENKWSLVTHSGVMTDCHARQALMTMEWKRRVSLEKVKDMYIGIGELIRDFGMTLPPHIQRTTRKGFGILGDACIWHFMTTMLCLEKCQVQYEWESVRLVADVQTENGTLVRQVVRNFENVVCKLLDRIKEHVTKSEKQGWQEHCVGEESWSLEEVLSEHKAIVAKLKLDGSKTMVFKFQGSVSERLALRRLEKEHDAAKRLRRMNSARNEKNNAKDEEEEDASLDAILPWTAEKAPVWKNTSDVTKGLRLLAFADEDRPECLIFEDHGWRLDQWCLCDGERRSALKACIQPTKQVQKWYDRCKMDGASTSTSTSTSLGTSVEEDVYSKSRVWQQLKAIHSAQFVLLDVCYTNIVWNGAEASLVDFETLVPEGTPIVDRWKGSDEDETAAMGEVRAVWPYEVHHFDVFGTQQEHFEAFYTEATGKTWTQAKREGGSDGDQWTMWTREATKWVDIFKMMLVNEWLDAVIRKCTGDRRALQENSPGQKIEHEVVQCEKKRRSPKREGGEASCSDGATKRKKGE